MIKVNKGKKGVTAQIYEQIKEEILTGVLSSGESLLPIRELAKELDVSKNTVNAAYLRLVEEGYVYSVPGSGYYVEKQQNLNNDNFEKIKNVKYNLTKSTDDIKFFPWELWEKCFTDAIDIIRKNINDNEYLLTQSNLSIRKSICSELRKNRGLSVSPNNVIVCFDMQNAIELIGRLFKNLSKDIMFLEPSEPAFKTMFQEDFFQVREMNRRMSKQASEENAFMVLFGYLEQFIEEFNREYPDNMWLKECSNVNLSIYDCIDYNKTLFVGNFDRIFPEELSITYLVLPDKLIQKIYNQKNNLNKIYPLSYQLALSYFLKDDKFLYSINKNQNIRSEKRSSLEKILNKVFVKKAKLMYEYCYMLDGIVFSIDNSNVNCENILAELKKHDISINTVNKFWCFQKDIGENIFAVSYNDYSEELLEKIFICIRNTVYK